MLRTSTQDQTEQEIYSNLLKRYGCPLCNEVLLNTYTTNCHHRFCRRCILKWLRYCQKCPKCISLISKISPLKRLDAEIERVYVTLPFPYRLYREELKKRRFRAELEWKRMKMAQGALTESQINRMKRAVETRQSLINNPSKRSFNRVRSMSMGQVVDASPNLLGIEMEDQNDKPHGKILNPGQSAKVEFLKAPPINYSSQESSKHLSTSSVDSLKTQRGNPFQTASFPSPRPDNKEHQPQYSNLEEVNNDRDFFEAQFSAHKSKIQELARRIERKSKGDVDEVEEFLSQCPVEKILENDLFTTFFKLHGASGEDHRNTEDSSDKPDISKTSRKKKQGWNNKREKNTIEPSLQLKVNNKNDRQDKVIEKENFKQGKIHPIPPPTVMTSKIKTNDIPKRASNLIRLEKKGSKKINSKESPNNNKSNNPKSPNAATKERASTVPLPSTSNKTRPKARISRLDLISSDDDKKNKPSKSPKKRLVSREKVNSPEMPSRKTKPRKESSIMNELAGLDFRKDSLKELLKKFREERETRKVVRSKTRPGTVFDQDLNPNTEVPGAGALNPGTPNQRDQSLYLTLPHLESQSGEPGPNASSKHKDPPLKSNVPQPKMSLQTPPLLITSDKIQAQADKIIAGLTRISKQSGVAYRNNDIKTELPENQHRMLDDSTIQRYSRAQFQDLMNEKALELLDRRKHDSTVRKSQILTKPSSNMNKSNYRTPMQRTGSQNKQRKTHSEHSPKIQGGKKTLKDFPSISSKHSREHKKSGKTNLSPLSKRGDKLDLKQKRSRVKHANSLVRGTDSNSNRDNIMEKGPVSNTLDPDQGFSVKIIKRLRSLHSDLSGADSFTQLSANGPIESRNRREWIPRRNGIPDYPLGLVQGTEVTPLHSNAPVHSSSRIRRTRGKNNNPAKLSPGKGTMIT